MSDQTEFKRLNFFTGFFTQAKDWKEGQAFHVEKQKLLHRGLHKPGIMQGLQVKPHPDGGLKLQVTPGVALDGAGNLIVLPDTRPLAVTLPDPLPALVYVAIEFTETESDYVSNAMDPDYSGYSRVTEQAVVTIMTSQPDNQLKVELARIALEPGVTGLVEPAEPDNPWSPPNRTTPWPTRSTAAMCAGLARWITTATRSWTRWRHGWSIFTRITWRSSGVTIAACSMPASCVACSTSSMWCRPAV